MGPPFHQSGDPIIDGASAQVTQACRKDTISGQPVGESPTQAQRAVCDFLAGMTDRYATRLFEVLFIPKPWPVRLG